MNTGLQCIDNEGVEHGPRYRVTRALQLTPKPEEFAELTTRRRDLMNLCRRLEALGSPRRGRWYEPAAWTILGALGGAAIAALALFGSDAHLANWVEPVYLVCLGALAVFAALLFHASKSVAEQRSDSVEAIRTELAGLVSAYELEDSALLGEMQETREALESELGGDNKTALEAPQTALSGRKSRTGPQSLTHSERRVAELAVLGLTVRDIAQQLFVTPKTVEFHLRHIYRKFGITERSELAHFFPEPEQGRGTPE